MGEAMNQMVVIDTDVLIDTGRGVSEALTCLQQLEQNACLAISAVTQMELLVGCRHKKEAKALDKFLARFQIVQLNEPISDMAVNLLRNYRLSHGILIPDALIAATALYLACSLVTKNQRDYRFVDGLRLPNYPHLSES
jgi:hypothetical protein